MHNRDSAPCVICGKPGSTKRVYCAEVEATVWRPLCSCDCATIWEMRKTIKRLEALVEQAFIEGLLFGHGPGSRDLPVGDAWGCSAAGATLARLCATLGDSRGSKK